MAGFSSSDSESDEGNGSNNDRSSRHAAARNGAEPHSSTGGSTVTVHGSTPTEGAALQAALASMADSDSGSDSSAENWDASAVAQAGVAAAQQARARGAQGPINLTMGNVQLPSNGPPPSGSPSRAAAHTPSSDWDRESTVGSASGTPKGAPPDKGAGLEQFLSDSDEEGGGASAVPAAVAAAIHSRGRGGTAAQPPRQRRPWERSLQQLVPPAPGPPGTQLPQASPLKTSASPGSSPAAAAGGGAKSVSPQVAAAATAELRQYTEQLLKGSGAHSNAFAAAQHDVMADPAWRRLLELAAAGAAGAAGGGRSKAFAVRASGVGGEGISIVTGRSAPGSADSDAGGAYIIEGGRGGSSGPSQTSGTVRRLGHDNASAFQRAQPSRNTPPKAAAPVVQGDAFSRLYQRQTGGQPRGGGGAFAAARAAKAQEESRRRAAAGAAGRRGHDAAARRAAVHEVLGERPVYAARRSPAAARQGYSGTWGSGAGRAAPFGSSIPRLAGKSSSPGIAGGERRTPPSNSATPPQRPHTTRASSSSRRRVTHVDAVAPARRGSFSAEAPAPARAAAASSARSAAVPPAPPPGVTATAKPHSTPHEDSGEWGLPFHSSAEHDALLGARLAADAAAVRALRARLAQLEAALAAAGLQA